MDEDIQLFEKLRKGDNHACRLFISRWNDKLYSKIKKKGLDKHVAIDDLLQVVWIKIWQTKHFVVNNDQPFSFWAFINRICKRACIDEIRKATGKDSLHHSESFDPDLAEADILDQVPRPLTPEQLNRFEQSEEVLIELMSRLDSETKDAFYFYSVEELSIKEIAQILDVNEERVKYLLKKARSKLQSLLSRYYYEYIEPQS